VMPALQQPTTTAVTVSLYCPHTHAGRLSAGGGQMFPFPLHVGTPRVHPCLSHPLAPHSEGCAPAPHLLAPQLVSEMIPLFCVEVVQGSMVASAPQKQAIPSARMPPCTARSSPRPPAPDRRPPPSPSVPDALLPPPPGSGRDAITVHCGMHYTVEYTTRQDTLWSTLSPSVGYTTEYTHCNFGNVPTTVHAT